MTLKETENFLYQKYSFKSERDFFERIDDCYISFYLDYVIADETIEILNRKIRSAVLKWFKKEELTGDISKEKINAFELNDWLNLWNTDFWVFRVRFSKRSSGFWD